MRKPNLGDFWPRIGESLSRAPWGQDSKNEGQHKERTKVQELQVSLAALEKAGSPAAVQAPVKLELQAARRERDAQKKPAVRVQEAQDKVERKKKAIETIQQRQRSIAQEVEDLKAKLEQEAENLNTKLAQANSELQELEKEAKEAADIVEVATLGRKVARAQADGGIVDVLAFPEGFFEAMPAHLQASIAELNECISTWAKQSAPPKEAKASQAPPPEEQGVAMETDPPDISFGPAEGESHEQALARAKRQYEEYTDKHCKRAKKEEER